MMTHSVDLGQRLLFSPQSDLTLSLQSSVLLLLPSERPFFPLPEHLRKLLCSGCIWVSQATEIKLKIRITCASEPLSSFARFVSQLGDTICKEKVWLATQCCSHPAHNPQLWKDLGLAVLYKSCLFEPGPDSSHILSFGIQRLVDIPDGNKAPKVPNVLRNVTDPVPPADISNVCITCIEVALVYSSASTPTTRLLRQSSQQQSPEKIPLTDFANCNYNEPDCSSEIISATALADDSLLELDNEEASGNWDLSTQTLPILSSFSELEELFQDALKTLVVGHAGRRRKRNQAGADGFQRLSTIAPAVFKPGYREVSSLTLGK